MGFGLPTTETDVTRKATGFYARVSEGQFWTGGCEAFGLVRARLAGERVDEVVLIGPFYRQFFRGFEQSCWAQRV
jgi:hypothetical protein